jgi:hypothetical protein
VFRGLGVSLILILLGVFLAFISSLGAGSSKRARKLLDAHQRRFWSQIKENTGFDRTDLCFLYCTENSHGYQFIKGIFQSSFYFHHSYPYLLITNRKRRSLTPYSTKKSLYREHCFASWFGTMASSQAPKFCCPLSMRETKRESQEARGGYRITSPRGNLGVTGIRGQRQKESNRTLGNSPRRWRRTGPYIDITHTLELEHTTLSISRSTVSLWELFVLQIKPISHAFLSFLSRCTTLEYFFPFSNLIIYIKIWQVWQKLHFCSYFALHLHRISIPVRKHARAVSIGRFCQRWFFIIAVGIGPQFKNLYCYWGCLVSLIE